VNLRDQVEDLLRSWNAYEISRGAPEVIDFDCAPTDREIPPASDRIAVREKLAELKHKATATECNSLASRLAAHLSYIDALLGVRLPLNTYIQLTQGCDARGWPAEYVELRRGQVQSYLERIGIKWDEHTFENLIQTESPLSVEEAPEVIRQASEELEESVRRRVNSPAPFNLSIQNVNIDAYWSYWLSGSGNEVLLRINLRNARFTQVQARQFALHEVLGHGLQCASFSDYCASNEVDWVRMTAVHAQQQVLLEGLAQALPLFLESSDDALIARVRLTHYQELVRAELHLAINSGTSIDNCVQYATGRVPWWNGERIADALSDRSTNPLLRSYLWAYPAGVDWFVNLADNAPQDVASTVLTTAYREPLSPSDLIRLWPQGPSFGGSGSDHPAAG
jgi:hypothetical protein